MTNMLENYESFYEINLKKISHKVFIDKMLYKKLYSCFSSLVNTDFFKKPFYMVFLIPNFKKDIFLYSLGCNFNEDNDIENIREENILSDKKIDYDALYCVASQNGLDILIDRKYLNETENLIFSIFSVKKGYKFNTLKNILFKNKRKDKSLINTPEKIIFFDNHNIELRIKENDLNVKKYENCNFSLILSKKMLIDLDLFLKCFLEEVKKKNFDVDFFYKVNVFYDCLDVEKEILFDMENAEISNFRIHFIQNRLFSIKYDKKEKDFGLFINDIYLTPVDNEIELKINKTYDSKNSNVFYNKNDSTLKLGEYRLF